jgi:hypothetical protein
VLLGLVLLAPHFPAENNQCCKSTLQEELCAEDASNKALMLVGLGGALPDHPGLAIALARGGLLAEAARDARLLGSADGEPGTWVSVWRLVGLAEAS